MRKLVTVLVAALLLLTSMPAAAAGHDGGRGRLFAGYVRGEVTFDFSNPKECTFFPLTTVTNASGWALHMGRTTMESSHCFVPYGAPEDNLGTAENATMVLTAANGDEVWATYDVILSPGLPEVIGEKIVARGTVTFDGGTGRFEDASGSAYMRSVVTFEGFEDPAWPYRGMWIGRLDY